MFTFGDLCLVSVPYNETSGFVFSILGHQTTID